MKHPRSLFLGCIVLIITATGCSKTPPPDPALFPASESPTYQYYSISYNKSQNTTTIYSELRLHNEQGQYIYPATTDSVLSVNGQLISSSDISTFPGMPDLEIRFRRKGMSFYNSVSPADISDIAFSAATPAELPLITGSATFTWDGPALGPDEEAEIEFTSLANSRSIILGLAGNTIVLDERTRPSFGVGPCKMTLRRIKHIQLPHTDSTAGGQMKIRLAVERDVMVK